MRATMTPERGVNDVARAPGWYLDPSDPTRKRYWDGESWRNMAVPAAGLPQLPPTRGRTVPRQVGRPDLDVVYVGPHHQHWTRGRIAGLVVTIALGSLGWGAVALGIVRLATGETSALVAVGVGLVVVAVLAIWAIVAYADRSYHATRRLHRAVGLAWLILLVAGIVAGFVTALAT